jgi:hypothetical protein
MSDYPEHDKQATIIDQTQAAGEFIDWLASEGIQLMTWREDLTDTRPTDPRCPHSRRDCEGCDHHRDDCAPVRGDEDEYGLILYSTAHCKHWQDPEREAEGEAEQGHCCRCGKGRFYELHGLKHWVSPGRSLIQLLADWQDIDLAKIEAEKRQMLASLRAANA